MYTDSEKKQIVESSFLWQHKEQLPKFSQLSLPQLIYLILYELWRTELHTNADLQFIIFFRQKLTNEEKIITGPIRESLKILKKEGILQFRNSKKEIASLKKVNEINESVYMNMKDTRKKRKKKTDQARQGNSILTYQEFSEIFNKLKSDLDLLKITPKIWLSPINTNKPSRNYNTGKRHRLETAEQKTLQSKRQKLSSPIGNLTTEEIVASPPIFPIEGDTPLPHNYNNMINATRLLGDDPYSRTQGITISSPFQSLHKGNSELMEKGMMKRMDKRDNIINASWVFQNKDQLQFLNLMQLVYLIVYEQWHNKEYRKFLNNDFITKAVNEINPKVVVAPLYDIIMPLRENMFFLFTTERNDFSYLEHVNVLHPQNNYKKNPPFPIKKYSEFLSIFNCLNQWLNLKKLEKKKAAVANTAAILSSLKAKIPVSFEGINEDEPKAKQPSTEPENSLQNPVQDQPNQTEGIQWEFTTHYVNEKSSKLR